MICKYGTPDDCGCHECKEPCDYSAYYGTCNNRCFKYYNCQYCEYNEDKNINSK